LFSLSCWLTKGGDFLGHDSALISKAGNTIANGMLTSKLNNLIKLNFHYTKEDTDANKSQTITSITTLPVIQQLKS